jgi:hypothetical protein
MVLKVGDAQLVSERLLNGNLCGVGVQNYHVTFTVEVMVRESIRLVIGIAVGYGSQLSHSVIKHVIIGARGEDD